MADPLHPADAPSAVAADAPGDPSGALVDPSGTTPGATGAASPLHARHDLLVLDLDGVLYVGPRAVPSAVEVLGDLELPRGFATNNASRTPEEVATHLRELGLQAFADEVATSSQAAARLVVQRLGRTATVLPVGGPGVRAALLEAGLRVTDDPAGRPDAVVQGFGRQLGWAQLCDVVVAVQGGALWVATNTDATIPTERGVMPGNGTLVAAVRRAVDVDPLVAGKPGAAVFDVVVERNASAAPLVIGDRLDTDVAGAVAAAMPSLLVLTGVTHPRQLLTADPSERPTHVAADLRGLYDVPVDLGALTAGDDGVWRCGDAAARLVEGAVSATGSTGDLAGCLDVLRAAAAAAWSVGPGGAPADAELGELLDDLHRRARP